MRGAVYKRGSTWTWQFDIDPDPLILCTVTGKGLGGIRDRASREARCPDPPAAGRTPRNGDPVARFWSKVDRYAGPDGCCWLWRSWTTRVPVRRVSLGGTGKNVLPIASPGSSSTGQGPAGGRGGRTPAPIRAAGGLCGRRGQQPRARIKPRRRDEAPDPTATANTTDRDSRFVRGSGRTLRPARPSGSCCAAPTTCSSCGGPEGGGGHSLTAGCGWSPRRPEG
jgi:hypothetical protein